MGFAFHVFEGSPPPSVWEANRHRARRCACAGRARGANHLSVDLPTLRRITPACAGSRTTPPGEAGYLRDHPRVRGKQIVY